LTFIFFIFFLERGDVGRVNEKGECDEWKEKEKERSGMNVVERVECQEMPRWSLLAQTRFSDLVGR
jgi:hypothetical protein